ncbi:[protein-PII] uridylyltransferase [Coralliovum pocilloporae]|uniref:[protein-PII] uridylyltransferase n=1 Tax=Coralliovum pocilloporae TaxID=3066369 RepID=UPI003D9C569E
MPRAKAPVFEPPVDLDQLRVELTALTQDTASDGSSQAVRNAVLSHLKQTMKDGRKAIEAQFLIDGSGLACARRLSDLQDTIIRALYDFAVYHVYRITNPSAGEKITLVAIGGYGRGTMAPGSDIDLLFLLPYKLTASAEALIEYILYMLWDMRLKVGHATRSIDDCIRLSKSDMTIRTSLLEARWVWGDKALFDEMVDRFDQDVVRYTGQAFIEAKLQERDDRHRRLGDSRYVLEPNIKEGKGGLRDLHTLFWIAKYFYRTEKASELVSKGVLTRSELQKVHKAEDFLWAVRCHMHFVTGRPEERLSFELQRELAPRLHYTAHAGLKDVERFMKHYFLTAKTVGDLTRVLCASLEEQHVKPTPGLNTLIRPFRRKRRGIKGVQDFVIENGRLTVADDDVFKRDPVNLLRLFQIAEKNNLAFQPHVLRLVSNSLKLIKADVRKDPEANRIFLDILCSPENGEITLRRMNETGVLGRFVPEFGKIVAMMQFNMYHHYTVDEHLLRSIGVLTEIDREKLEAEHPLSHSLMPDLADPTILYVALFLHDIAKGRPEDHSVEGAKIARKLCPRFGLSPTQTDAVAWLIENHLVMSSVAQSRDLQDRKTIEDFAAVVQTLERLKMLLILTVADIKAVGPGVFTGWKGQLLRTLYSETESYLTGGHSAGKREHLVQAAKSELLDALSDWSSDERDAYFELHYPGYWLRVDTDRKIEHAGFIRETDQAGQSFAYAIKPLTFEGVTEITILAPDHPRLLSLIAGACSVGDANIADAQIYTTTDGRALDTIFLERSFDTDADEKRRAERIVSLIENALRGRKRLPDPRSQDRAAGKRRKTFATKTEVTLDNELSNRFSVIEVSGLDRSGLLFDLTRALSRLNLNIISAHIATYGERAVDVFYVTDLTGAKITAGGRRKTITNQLRRAFDGTEASKEAAAASR